MMKISKATFHRYIRQISRELLKKPEQKISTRNGCEDGGLPQNASDMGDLLKTWCNKHGIEGLLQNSVTSTDRSTHEDTLSSVDLLKALEHDTTGVWLQGELSSISPRYRFQKKLNVDQQIMAVKSYLSGESKRSDVCSEMDISKTTLHRYIKKMNTLLKKPMQQVVTFSTRGHASVPPGTDALSNVGCRMNQGQILSPQENPLSTGLFVSNHHHNFTTIPSREKGMRGYHSFRGSYLDELEHPSTQVWLRERLSTMHFRNEHQKKLNVDQQIMMAKSYISGKRKVSDICSEMKISNTTFNRYIRRINRELLKKVMN